MDGSAAVCGPGAGPGLRAARLEIGTDPPATASARTVNHAARIGFLLSVLICGIGSAGRAAAQSGAAMDTALARRMVSADTALAVFARVCPGAESIWGRSLCGRMILVDGRTRNAVANEALPPLGFTRHGDHWRGVLPDSILIANTASEIGGERWSMILLDVPEERFQLIQLLSHESFHRIQPSLGLWIGTPLPAHLEKEKGRLWLRLELRALDVALQRGGSDSREAAADAMWFRRARYVEFPGADTLEAKLEIQEGLAAFTGAVVARDAMGWGDSRVAGEIRTWEDRESYGRTFAYGTGPALGVLLDRFSPAWRKQLTPDLPLHVLLARTIAPETLTAGEEAIPTAMERAKAYGIDEVAAQEEERAIRTRALLDSLRSRFTGTPRLVLKGTGVQLAFDPATITSIEGLGTVYGVGRFQGEWGAIDVEAGALISPDFTTVTVAGPVSGGGSQWSGPGWTLDLADGWHIETPEPGVWRVVHGN